jgi:hypothetical protein
LAAWDESEAERETADFERERQARPLRVRKHDRPKSATELRRQAIATLPPDVQRDYDEWERRAYGPQQEVAVQEVAVSGTSSSGEADPDGEWEDVPGIGRVRIVR